MGGSSTRRDGGRRWRSKTTSPIRDHPPTAGARRRQTPGDGMLAILDRGDHRGCRGAGPQRALRGRRLGRHGPLRSAMAITLGKAE